MLQTAANFGLTSQDRIVPMVADAAGGATITTNLSAAAGLLEVANTFPDVIGNLAGLIGNMRNAILTVSPIHPGPYTIPTLLRCVSSFRGFIAVGLQGTILTSPDGETWTKQNSDTDANLYDLIYGAGQLVVVGQNGTILTSQNGINWISRAFGFGGDFRGITYSEGQFIVVGTGGIIATSSDAITWIPKKSNSAYDLRGVTHGSIPTSTIPILAGETIASLELLIAVGANGTILASPDKGESWYPQTLSDGDAGALFTEVTYGSERFFATKEKLEILISQNGINWTARAQINYGYGTGTACLNGLFIHTSNNGYGVVRLFVSSDGITWTSRFYREIGTACGGTYANGLFVFVGGYGTACSTLISRDGIGWTYQVIGNFGYVHRVIYANMTP
jgi:hypothetical protein